MLRAQTKAESEELRAEGQEAEPSYPGMAVSVQLRRLRNAITHAGETFLKNKRTLADLSPHFWFALGSLSHSAQHGTKASELCAEVLDSSRVLGAPGDFGYGMPCGDALREVYDAQNELCVELKKFNVGR